MSSSSTVHGGQYDTQYVAFETLVHAAFVADTIWGDKLEPVHILSERGDRWSLGGRTSTATSDSDGGGDRQSVHSSFELMLVPFGWTYQHKDAFFQAFSGCWGKQK